MAESFVTLKSPVWEERMPGVFLSYIESTGTQWINTDVKLNDISKIGCSIVADAQLTQAGQQQSLFGCSDSMYYDCAIDALANNTWSTGTRYGFNKTVSDNNILNRVIATSTTAEKLTPSTYYGTAHVTLFGNYQASQGKVINLCTGRNFGSYITNENEEKLRDMKPFQLTESVVDYWGNTQPSGTVGMWDLVSNKFFPNNGTGNFIAGQPV